MKKYYKKKYAVQSTMEKLVLQLEASLSAFHEYISDNQLRVLKYTVLQIFKTSSLVRINSPVL